MHRELDKFYTKHCVAKKCIEESWPLLDKYNTYVEPSAGAGSFLHALEQQDVYDVVSYDLLPESNYFTITQSDWFDVRIPETYGSVAVVGNPPFGKRNKLSKAFIQHAISFDAVDCVAMILSNAWEKHTLQTIFPHYWSLVVSNRLDPYSFTLDGEDYKVPCVWQVWIKDWEGEDLRWEENPPTACKDFTIVLNKSEAHFFIMGASPKTLKEIPDVHPNNRGYYIKSNIEVGELKRRLKDVDWNARGCATAGGGVYWITKPELVKYYTDYHG